MIWLRKAGHMGATSMMVSVDEISTICYANPAGDYGVPRTAQSRIRTKAGETIYVEESVFEIAEAIKAASKREANA